MEDHQTKLKNYKNNPLKYDNKNMLKNAATQEIWDSIYYGRIAHLETEIATFLAEITEAEAAIDKRR